MKDDWISVEDRLPNPNIYAWYLTYNGQSMITDMFGENGTNNDMDFGEAWAWGYKVTHWKKIKPPVKENT